MGPTISRMISSSRVDTTAGHAPPPATGSHLLQLPAELRLAIYEYVLMTPQELWYYPVLDDVGHMYTCNIALLRTTDGKGDSRRSRHAAREANQMRHVNRQMHRETRGLLLRNNDFAFCNVQELAAFLRSCPVSAHKDFRRLTVHDPIYLPAYLRCSHGDEEAVQQVFEFCRQTPNVLIRNTFKLRLSCRFILDAIRLEMAARKTLILLESSYSFPHFRDTILEVMLDIAGVNSLADLPEVAPANFRLHPQLEDPGPETALLSHRACIEDNRTRCRILLQVTGGSDEWTDLVQRILREGI